MRVGLPLAAFGFLFLVSNAKAAISLKVPAEVSAVMRSPKFIKVLKDLDSLAWEKVPTEITDGAFIEKEKTVKKPFDFTEIKVIPMGSGSNTQMVIFETNLNLRRGNYGIIAYVEPQVSGEMIVKDVNVKSPMVIH